MCGIVGSLCPAVNVSFRDWVIRARDIIKYRGPDDSGIYEDAHVCLAHVRLSILDLSNLAAQPMVSHAGRYVFTYNGEIYNYASLREDLAAKNVVLKSSGDTEVVLEYIAAFGVARCLERAEGMFAFALWDRDQRKLYLARDRHGIKPLYFAVTNGRVCFASEMKALLDFARGPDYTTVNAAMLGLGCAYDFRTLLNGIESVRAGEVISFSESTTPTKNFFFRLPDFVDQSCYARLDQSTPSSIVKETNDALKESMRLCMISDAPLAVLASGGIDSSLIAAIANESHPNLKLYHANVVGASETPAAEVLARHLSCDLFSEKVTEQDTLDYTSVVTYHYEMPLMYHTNAVPFYLVSRLASSHGIKVVLTGEGADEYFIGYADMAIYPLLQRYRRVMQSIQKLVHMAPGFGRLIWPITADTLAEQLRSTLFRYELDERRTEGQAVYGFVKNWSDRLLSYMSLDMCEGNIPPLLHRNDRLGMAWGIESRFPFLGHSVARLGLSMPAKYKIRSTLHFFDKRHPFIMDKWCVRKVADQYLPRQLTHRGKYAFRGVVYSRLKLNRTFFKGGFVSDFYGLGEAQLDLMLEKASPAWKSRLFLLDIWGRLFCCGQSVETVRTHVRANADFDSSNL